jgi:hypothetical protein
MKITTSNPVLIDEKKVDPIDMYLSAEGKSDEETYDTAGIKVTTMNPVIIDDKNASFEDFYSNFGGVTSSAAQQVIEAQKKISGTPSMEQQAKAKQKGQFWNKAKGAWEKISNSPAAQFALEQLATYFAQKRGGMGTNDFSSSQPITSPPPPLDEEKMSTTTKVLLGVGGALVLGLIIYAVVSGGSKGKSNK